jgi:hypothetical protein
MSEKKSETKIGGPILSIALFLLVLYLAVFVLGCPKHHSHPLRAAEIQRNAICPFDGNSAWYTHQQYTDDKGIVFCQYKHIHFRITSQGLVVEEPHIFWIVCQEE